MTKRNAWSWKFSLPLMAAVALAFALSAFAGSYPDIQACAGETGSAKGGCCNEQYNKCARTCNGSGGCQGYCVNLFNQCMGTGNPQ